MYVKIHWTGFQSTRPHGARRISPEGLALEMFVSIHAPTRGATSGGRQQGGILRCFNPRAHTGRDLYKLLRGLFCVRFNPRAHTGRDVMVT